jgi:hypothetical protein
LLNFKTTGFKVYVAYKQEGRKFLDNTVRFFWVTELRI